MTSAPHLRLLIAASFTLAVAVSTHALQVDPNGFVFMDDYGDPNGTAPYRGAAGDFPSNPFLNNR